MRSPLALPAVVLTLVLAGGAACGGDEPSPAGEPSPGAAPGATPVAPIGSRDASPPPGAPGPGAPVRWTLPAGWQEEPPSSTMRMAQASIPGPGGAAEMAVFHFGAGGGGGVEANFERWVGQVEGDAEPERGSFESGPYRVSWVTVPGTYDPGMVGMGPSEPQPGWRLLGAVVEGDGGPWFFKLTGPDATVEAAREDFFALLRSVRPAG